MNLKDVIIHIRIEEKNKEREKIERAKEITFKANIIESKPSKPSKYFPKPNFKSNQNPKMKRNSNSTFKKKENYFVCGKLGYYSAQYRFRKTSEAPSKPQASLVESDIITIVISKVSMDALNKNWVIDSGATQHMCADRGAISSYSFV